MSPEKKPLKGNAIFQFSGDMLAFRGLNVDLLGRIRRQKVNGFGRQLGCIFEYTQNKSLNGRGCWKLKVICG